METLESSRVCRLCGQHSGICINIFDKTENHVKKINAVLPILVHEMDLLPKQMCHRCSYKLEEFHKFYSDCLKTDMDLKSQLSWMRKREVKEHIRVPMVQIENVKIKSEPPDYDIYELDPIVENVNYISSMSSMTYSMNRVRNNNEVNSRKINDIDKRLTCDNDRLSDCTDCKLNNYGKKINTTNNEAALSINSTNMKSIHDIRRDSSSNDLGSSSRLNTFRNSVGNVSLKDSHKSKKKIPIEMIGLNISNILNTNEVKEIKIKTEKPDDIEIRSLRPRKKSVDYLGTKRKKSTLIVNPANISRNINIKRKSMAKQVEDSVVNGIVIEQIKKEPLEEVRSRALRPRKFLIDYLGSKRKETSCARTDPKKRTKCEVIRAKRYKSSNSFEETSSFGSSKCFTGLIPDTNNFKVKEEIISDDETANVEIDGETRCNDIADSCVRNLSNLFDRETERAIKLETNSNDGLSDCEWEATPTNSRVSRGSKSLKPKRIGLKKNTNCALGPAKRISDANCSPKYLRSQDLRLRNGKVKKSESSQQLSLRGLKKKFLQLASTAGHKLGRKENLNVMKVPTTLKTASNIKHFCEKCCTSFMNKELYMLHVCYFD